MTKLCLVTVIDMAAKQHKIKNPQYTTNIYQEGIMSRKRRFLFLRLLKKLAEKFEVQLYEAYVSSE